MSSDSDTKPFDDEDPTFMTIITSSNLMWIGNTPQSTNYTATCLSSRKLFKLDEPDTQDTAGEARTNSSVMYSYGPPHMAKQK